MTAARSVRGDRRPTAGRRPAGRDPAGRSRRTRDWRPLTPAEPTAGSGSGRPARAQRARTPQRAAVARGSRAGSTVAPRSSIAWFHDQPRPGGTAASAAACASRRCQRPAPATAARTRATLVSTTPTSRSKREGQHGPRRVRADARQREQRVEVVGEGAAVPLDDAPTRTGGGSGPGGCTPAPPRR